MENEQEYETPFGPIKELKGKHFMSKELFQYIFGIDDIFDRDRLILELEEKAKEFKIDTKFKKMLKQYEKKNETLRQSKDKVTHNEVADVLMKNNNVVVFENDVYIYKNGVYCRQENDISKEIIKLVPDSNTYFRKEVYNYLLLTAPEKSIRKESNIINFKNGLFKTDVKMLLKHTPEFFSVNQINTDLNFNAKKVQAIDDVLDRLSSGNDKRRQTLLEMIGYCMTTSVKFQKAFILYGETARNGKSTLINIITKLIGSENIGTVSFKEMNKNRFAASGIKSKLLNTGSEMTNEYIEDIEIFKNFITGDELEIEEKFKPRQKISPYAKFIFSANELPIVADKTNGFYRRLQIIPLEYSFTDKDAQNFNFNELVSKEALEYLARISLEAYLNMGEKFSNYEESDVEVNKYKINSNSILTFINDEEYLVPFIEESSVRYASLVYAHYKQYCAENQYRPIGMQKFYKELEKSGLIARIGKHNNQKVYTFNKDFYAELPNLPTDKVSKINN